jgi:hypothetical protein
MPPRRPLGRETITVVRAPLEENPRTGALVRNWDNATETVVKNCNVQPFPLAEKLNFEFLDNREYARSSLRVYAPAGTSVEPTDKILYRGKTYEVFGFSGDWQDFHGVPHHVAFVMRIREG